MIQVCAIQDNEHGDDASCDTRQGVSDMLHCSSETGCQRARVRVPRVQRVRREVGCDAASCMPR